MNEEIEEVCEEYLNIIKVFNASIWENKAMPCRVQEWLENFSDSAFADISKQKLHALYLLTHFMYFGTREVREMLKYIYEYLFKYPMIREIRKSNGDSTNIYELEKLFQIELKKNSFFNNG